MDVIKNNLKFLVVCIDRLDRLSIECPSNKETYDRIAFMDIDRFVKESASIIRDINRSKNK